MIEVVVRRNRKCRPPTGWFKSSFSASNSSCVEVQFNRENVLIRDTKDQGEGPTISVTADQWQKFLDELTCDSEKICPNGAMRINRSNSGAVLLESIESGIVLHFTDIEWAMFLAGVREDEFSI